MHHLSSSPAKPLKGTLIVPGDKSISHRAVILGAIAKGITTVHGFLEAEDCLATVSAFRSMGVLIELSIPNKLLIHGAGKYGLQAPSEPIDCKNSGTTLRLLAGLLAAQPFNSILFGDKSLQKRPMARISLPLQEMGAQIETQQGTPPLSIQGGKTLRGMEYTLPVASAQVKSCLLLAGLYATESLQVIEPKITRDHTENLLEEFAYPIERVNKKIIIDGRSECIGTEIFVPGDISSAAFFIVAATLIPDSELVINNVGVNPTRIGLITTLIQMGAHICFENRRVSGGEAVADLVIKHAPLQGTKISESLIPQMIDELPILCIAAAMAEGETIIRGAHELRFKESDRIHAMAEGLIQLGVKIKILEDGLIIEGKGGEAFFGGEINSFYDHRIAMAFAVAGSISKSPVIINNSDCVATSFPTFVEMANQINMSIQEWHDLR